MVAPWKESYEKPRQCIIRQRYHFADRGLYSQSYGFSVVVHRCESWTIKKVECQTDALKLWCWRRLLRVLWTVRRSHQSTLNIHWKHYCWGWSTNILANWWEEPTHWKRPWCWERLRARGGDRGSRGWRWLDSITNSMDMSLSKLQETVQDRGACCAVKSMGCKESGMT